MHTTLETWSRLDYDIANRKEGKASLVSHSRRLSRFIIAFNTYLPMAHCVVARVESHSQVTSGLNIAFLH